MKHIAFAIGSLHGGGAERVVSVWASALAEKGYSVSVIVYARVEDEYPINNKVKVFPITASPEECDSLPIMKRLILFRKTLKKLRPHVIISFLPIIQVYMRIASIGLGISRIETIRLSPWDTEMMRSKFRSLWLNCFESCNALILQSNDQKPFFSEKVQKKSVVIPNPINPIYFENRKEVYDSNSHNIVAAGRLSLQKNYKMMIDAVNIVSKEYDDISLCIYGIGTLEEELRNYILELRLSDKIKLMGRSQDLYNVYKNADLYLMSSDFEGMPNALAEAMAIGVPCISTDCKTGPKDLIDDSENGYLVPCGDPEALAEKIKQVFSLSDEEQQRLGMNARKKVGEFCGEENSLNRLISLIEKV